MSFPDAVKICFSEYVDFSGRARRSEFWWWVLFTFLLGIVASVIDVILGTRNSTGTGLVETVANLAVLLPSIAVGARRLHDTGRSAWWLLLWFVCLIGWIFLIVWFCQDSQGTTRTVPRPSRASPARVVDPLPAPTAPHRPVPTVTRLPDGPESFGLRASSLRRSLRTSA